jgi:hypothetical protein
MTKNEDRGGAGVAVATRGRPPRGAAVPIGQPSGHGELLQERRPARRPGSGQPKASMTSARERPAEGIHDVGQGAASRSIHDVGQGAASRNIQLQSVIVDERRAIKGGRQAPANFAAMAPIEPVAPIGPASAAVRQPDEH